MYFQFLDASRKGSTMSIPHHAKGIVVAMYIMAVEGFILCSDVLGTLHMCMQCHLPLFLMLVSSFLDT